MIDIFKRLFVPGSDAEEGKPLDERSVRIATCALLLEMAGIDGAFDPAEQEHILSVFRREYGLSDGEIEELIAASRQALEESVDLWQFASRINRSCSTEDKTRIIEMIWGVVYADGVLDRHEDYLMHKLAQLLRVDHDALIAAKLRIMHGDAKP
jgi:uncharacterized tellurite resistance protein B-like protein